MSWRELTEWYALITQVEPMERHEEAQAMRAARQAGVL